MTVSESSKNDGMNIFKERWKILKGINGSVAFTVINVFKINIHCILLSYLEHVGTPQIGMFYMKESKIHDRLY